jgi:hypothetical protein
MKQVFADSTADETWEFLTKPEIAERLKKTPRTIEIYMAEGLLPYVKLRHSTLFHWPTVVESLKARMK